MKIHREGRVSLTVVAIFVTAVTFLAIWLTHNPIIVYPVIFASLAFYLFIMYFFRVVERPTINDEKLVIAPCDGRVVVIEEVVETEYFNEARKQVSIFMSPLNVHMNWFPVGGKILVAKRQKGSHMVAWAPKSSVHNERSTVVVETFSGQHILVRQIAGAVARRVVCYAQEGMYAEQNGHLGFIKFGSRVDLFLPLDAEINVKLEQPTVGTQTVIARLK